MYAYIPRNHPRYTHKHWHNFLRRSAGLDGWPRTHTHPIMHWGFKGALWPHLSSHLHILLKSQLLTVSGGHRALSVTDQTSLECNFKKLQAVATFGADWESDMRDDIIASCYKKFVFNSYKTSVYITLINQYSYPSHKTREGKER